VSEGILANIAGKPAALASGTLDYCRRAGILVQAWSPVAGGRLFAPPESATAEEIATSAVINRLASEHETTEEAIALGWLLRHPAGIQPIVGTTNVDRLAASCRADDVELTREEWYALLEAARGERVP
jgi:predicted oxidoreductase